MCSKVKAALVMRKRPFEVHSMHRRSTETTFRGPVTSSDECDSETSDGDATETPGAARVAKSERKHARPWLLVRLGKKQALCGQLQKPLVPPLSRGAGS